MCSYFIQKQNPSRHSSSKSSVSWHPYLRHSMLDTYSESPNPSRNRRKSKERISRTRWLIKKGIVMIIRDHSLGIFLKWLRISSRDKKWKCWRIKLLKGKIKLICPKVNWNLNTLMLSSQFLGKISNPFLTGKLPELNNFIISLIYRLLIPRFSEFLQNLTWKKINKTFNLTKDWTT